MINPPDKSESQNQANENPIDSKFTRDALAAASDISLTALNPTGFCVNPERVSDTVSRGLQAARPELCQAMTGPAALAFCAGAAGTFRRKNSKLI